MTKFLNLNNESEYATCIKEAVTSLKNGKIVGFPTETVYGLGANANDDSAISLLYQIKRRHSDKKFTVLIANKTDISLYTDNISRETQKLMEKFWPGPMTLVVPGNKGGDVGIRAPDHRVAVDLITRCGFPIVAPSANISGEPPLTNAKEVFNIFKNKIDIVLDYDETNIGMASTVIKSDKNGVKILRHGAISDKEVYDCLKH